MKEKDIIGAVVIAVITALLVSLVGCEEVPDVDLSNVVIDGYVVKEGNNDVFDQSITVEDVIGTLGSNYKDKVYDYGQGLRTLEYNDVKNNKKIEFVYLETANGNIIDWIDVEKIE